MLGCGHAAQTRWCQGLCMHWLHIKGGVPCQDFKPTVGLLWQTRQSATCSLKDLQSQVTTTDQATAEVSKEKEPLRTLQTFRKGSTLGWTRVTQWKACVFFCALALMLWQHKVHRMLWL